MTTGTVAHFIVFGTLPELDELHRPKTFDPCMACAIHLVDATGNELGATATGLSVCVQ